MAEELGALIEGIKQNIETEIHAIPAPDGRIDDETTSNSILVVSSGEQGMRVVSLKPLIDEYRKKPEFLEGTSTHAEVESFIAHVNRFKAENSVVFGDRSGLSLTAYYDYHEKYGKPDNLKHRAKFAPPLSRQLKVWREGDKKAMTQGDFAAFIEANILDLTEAPSEGVAVDIAAKLNTTIASPSRLLELSRGLSVHEAATAKSHIDISTGEVTLEYTTAHSGGDGKKLKLPGLFVLGIPVFEGGALYRVLVRLRYRLQEGKVKWWYELYQLDVSIEDAFDEIVERVETETALTVYIGTAERS